MSTNTILIEKGTTRAVVHVSRHHPYAPYVRGVIVNHLTDYDWVQQGHRKARVPTRRFVSVDPNGGKVYIPINAADLVKDELVETGLDVKIQQELPVVARPINLKMIKRFQPKDAEQAAAIEYLSQPMPHRKGLATNMGSGKTVSTIAAIVKQGQAAMIVVGGLHDQWAARIKEFTNAKPKDVYIVQGIDSLVKLMEAEYKPAIIIWSLRTLQLYCQHQGAYQDLPPYEKFIEYFGIGVKIMDEVHLNFHAETLIDLKSRIANNVYLTATFTAASDNTRRIFSLIYPPEMRFGEGSFKKFIDVYIYTYFGDVDPRKCEQFGRGYSHVKYETQIFKRVSKLNTYLQHRLAPVIRSHLVNKGREGDKLLIYFSTLHMVDIVCSWIRQEFPEYRTNKYIGGVDDDVFKESDILVSTPKKAGCGTDIKGLRFVIQTVSTKAPTTTDQVRGRLRELEDGISLEYAELVDLNLPKHMAHLKEREFIHRRKAKSLTKLQLA